MTYERHLLASERHAWSLEGSIPWGEIDRESAGAERDLLASLHDAALIEGYLPVFIPRMMRLLWDDVDATAVFSLELYEGLKHYTALRRYMDLVGYRPAAAADERVVAARARTVDVTYSTAEVLTQLTNFMCSELYAAFFFLRLSRRTREPVLRRLLTYMTRDEFRHGAGAADLIRKRIAADPEEAARVLQAAASFRHYGNDVVEVPVAQKNDFEAIVAVNRKVRQLCGLGRERGREPARALAHHEPSLEEALLDGDQ